MFPTSQGQFARQEIEFDCENISVNTRLFARNVICTICASFERYITLETYCGCLMLVPRFVEIHHVYVSEMVIICLGVSVCWSLYTR